MTYGGSSLFSMCNLKILTNDISWFTILPGECKEVIDSDNWPQDLLSWDTHRWCDRPMDSSSQGLPTQNSEEPQLYIDSIPAKDAIYSTEVELHILGEIWPHFFLLRSFVFWD